MTKTATTVLLGRTVHALGKLRKATVRWDIAYLPQETAAAWSEWSEKALTGFRFDSGAKQGNDDISMWCLLAFDIFYSRKRYLVRSCRETFHAQSCVRAE